MSDDIHLRNSVDGLIAAAKLVARENLNTIGNLERQLAAITKKAEAEFAALEAIERRIHEVKR